MIIFPSAPSIRKKPTEIDIDPDFVGPSSCVCRELRPQRRADPGRLVRA
jgi:hypothetical protein